MAIYINDEDMIYDLKTHRYVLTQQYILSTYGVDLNTMSGIKEDAVPSSAADRFLKLLSRQLYAYIYEYADNKDLTEYLLAGGKPEWRDALKEAMGEFVYAFRITGNIFSFETGLSLDKGLELTKEQISTQYIPIAARNILEVNDILFRGKRTGYNMKEIRELKSMGEF